MFDVKKPEKKFTTIIRTATPQEFLAYKKWKAEVARCESDKQILSRRDSGGNPSI